MKEIEQKHSMRKTFVERLKQVCKRIDPLNEKGNKGFAIEMGISEQSFSYYWNGKRYPSNIMYHKIIHYFEKHISNFNEDYLTGKSESMTKENSVIVKTFRANEDLSVKLYELKEYHDTITTLLSLPNIKQVLQSIKDIQNPLEADIINLVYEWKNVKTKHVDEKIVYMLKSYLEKTNVEQYKINLYTKLVRILNTISLDSIINVLNDILGRDNSTNLYDIDNEEFKSLNSFLKCQYHNILDLI